MQNKRFQFRGSINATPTRIFINSYNNAGTYRRYLTVELHKYPHLHNFLSENDSKFVSVLIQFRDDIPSVIETGVNTGDEAFTHDDITDIEFYRF